MELFLRGGTTNKKAGMEGGKVAPKKIKKINEVYEKEVHFKKSPLPPFGIGFRSGPDLGN